MEGLNVDEFEVEFQYSGKTGTVGPNDTIMSIAEAVGIEVPFSCREGICGTCETPVIEGEVIHRDTVLGDVVHSGHASMAICVSRSATPRLVIDL